MTGKILGYIVTLIGLAGFAFTFDVVNAAIKVPGISLIGKTPLTVVSLIIIALGLFLVIQVGGSSKQPKEVPIYHGDKVVGFRRLGK
ncbi:MAG: hypothetical protein WCK90_00010 [archaeon]